MYCASGLHITQVRKRKCSRLSGRDKFLLWWRVLLQTKACRAAEYCLNYLRFLSEQHSITKRQRRKRNVWVLLNGKVPVIYRVRFSEFVALLPENAKAFYLNFRIPTAWHLFFGTPFRSMILFSLKMDDFGITYSSIMKGREVIYIGIIKSLRKWSHKI